LSPPFLDTSIVFVCRGFSFFFLPRMITEPPLQLPASPSVPFTPNLNSVHFFFPHFWVLSGPTSLRSYGSPGIPPPLFPHYWHFLPPPICQWMYHLVRLPAHTYASWAPLPPLYRGLTPLCLFPLFTSALLQTRDGCLFVKP